MPTYLLELCPRIPRAYARSLRTLTRSALSAAFRSSPPAEKKMRLAKQKMRSAKNALSAAFRFSPPVRKTKKQYEDTCIAVCGHR